MNRFILFIIFVFSFVIGYSQRTTKVSATYTYYAPETMSIEEAKRIALDRAKIQAIADKFGTIVSQSTTTVISNKNGESDTQFFALGGSDVKGEWIETFGNPEYQLQFENHYLVVTCSVKGKAREITSAKIEFTATTLRNGTELRFEDVNFRDGDDLYLYFQSPINGYLAVYLLDEIAQTVYCILPYKAQTFSAYPVEANKEYVMFSRKEADKSERSMVDEYTLSCENEKEFNTLFILFSPSQFGKRNGFDDSIEDKPNNISYNEFKKWLSKLQIKDKKIQVEQTSIIISK
ncbi:MAG: DUF4384 domain-containing protein [Bacteroides sp.]|nr:DUF4384 domain-containing protein [Bacteroides sp.]